MALGVANFEPKAEAKVASGRCSCRATFSGRSIEVCTSTDVQMPKTRQQPDKIRRGARRNTNFSIGFLHEFLKKRQKAETARCVRRATCWCYPAGTKRLATWEQRRPVIVTGAVPPLASLARLPNFFAGPLTRPLRGHEVVARRRSRAGPNLDQILNLETCATQQAKPVPM